MALALLICSSVVAQDKEEREWRVKSKTVPKQAMDWFKDAYEIPKKVKWYKEQNETGLFYEAKLNRKKHRNSVKFSEAGEIQDIEIELKLDELESGLASAIDKRLDSISSSYRIIKLQQQWTGEADDLEDLIDEKEKENLTTKYEVELFIRSGKEAGYYELLFSDKGELLLKRPIKMNTADHLQY